ncbi:hypothetical protein GGTG_04011 [Gaeumannomyces tritici R3-111a-1]|uniref:Uncharacterized protein n=1 Tax=Gaeumannomyces tritici (strain R3-111a-1) TaxID=644352 RepID=J3NRW3_GAET3|nr:hypothetical protein GGTG_04011 [Gaeumannomyces tritici R3-111a-1]EJT78919.1 hypothetical protein GGTG_04011 [Gaeumannomyces tritici R3-111a-1]
MGGQAPCCGRVELGGAAHSCGQQVAAVSQGRSGGSAAPRASDLAWRRCGYCMLRGCVPPACA